MYPEADRETKKNLPAGHEALLREIRDQYQYFKDYWDDARRDRARCMRYLNGDPWEPEDKKARADAGRPAINHDELNQYVFQALNSLRKNKRGIRVGAAGNGANDKTAELRQDLIRTEEYHSKAPAVYLAAAQDMYEGGYGFFRLGREYVVDDPEPGDPRAFDQRITFSAIPNPDSVLYDPHCKKPDWSDAQRVFVLDPLSYDDFAERFPNASKTDFDAEDRVIAKGWIDDKQILVAEYWKVVSTMGTYGRGKRIRTTVRKKLVQYITNGIEILEENPQPGAEIPIISMIGLQRMVDEGKGPKRKLFALPSFALDPQMSHAYLCSQEMEEAGLSPKVPVIGYTGQFDTDADAWEMLNKIPRAFIQVDPVTEASSGQLLPLPQWRQFVPNFQEYELAKDSCRRAIQAAMGVSPLPTAAQRNNEKSGIALERIQDEQAIGSYHYVDGFEAAVERAGRIADSWVKPTYDTEREMGLVKADDSRRIVRLNTDEPYPNEKGDLEHYPIGDEEHDITISTAPAAQSQRDAVDKFLDNLLANLPTLPVPPPAAAKLLALAIRMKDLGPIGDQMVDTIDPQQPDQTGQMQQQLQMQAAAMQQMQQEFQKLQLEKQGRVVDNEYKMALEKLRIEADIAKAEITSKAQNLSERLQFVEDAWKQLHAQAHEAGMQAVDQTAEQQQAQQQQAHEAGLAHQDRQTALLQQAGKQMHERHQAGAQQAHERGAQLFDADTQQRLAQQQEPTE